MKTFTKFITLIMLSGAFLGCTIVMPTTDTAGSRVASSTSNSKESTYKRPTPTSTAGSSSKPNYTRPTPTSTAGSSSKPAYTRPTPTTTAGANSSEYKRPVISTTTTPESTSTSTKQGSDGRIDAPGKKKNTNTSVADTTKQARSRVRR